MNAVLLWMAWWTYRLFGMKPNRRAAGHSKELIVLMVVITWSIFAYYISKKLYHWLPLYIQELVKHAVLEYCFSNHTHTNHVATTQSLTQLEPRQCSFGSRLSFALLASTSGRFSCRPAGLHGAISEPYPWSSDPTLYAHTDDWQGWMEQDYCLRAILNTTVQFSIQDKGMSGMCARLIPRLYCITPPTGVYNKAWEQG